MSIGIMQPYFLPYLGYFSLIKNSQEFYLLEDVQFIRHGWIERNRILKPVEGWQYFGVPLASHTRTTKIKDIFVAENQNWRDRILSQLQHYKKRAPYYKQTITVLEHAFAELDNVIKITEINKILLQYVCSYLGINTPISIFSLAEHPLKDINEPDDWALQICKTLGADSYINPPGGKAFFDEQKYINNGVELKFLSINLKPYPQRRGPDNIILGLSIVDVMMFNDIPNINNMLEDYEFI